MGGGRGDSTPTISWLSSALVGSVPFSSYTDSTLFDLCCRVRHGDPHLHSVGFLQGLVDGVAGPQGRLFACATTPQSLVVSLVCSKEPGRGARCLSMESSPYSPYGIFHAQEIGNQVARTHDLILWCHFRLRYIINLQKSALVPFQVILHLGSLIHTTRGLEFVGPNPCLCSTPTSGDRTVGIVSRPCSPVHVLSLSLVDSPERSLRHEHSLT